MVPEETDGRERRVVVGMDGSPQAMSALEWAASLAEDHGARSSR